MIADDTHDNLLEMMDGEEEGKSLEGGPEGAADSDPVGSQVQVERSDSESLPAPGSAAGTAGMPTLHCDVVRLTLPKAHCESLRFSAPAHVLYVSRDEFLVKAVRTLLNSLLC